MITFNIHSLVHGAPRRYGLTYKGGSTVYCFRIHRMPLGVAQEISPFPKNFNFGKQMLFLELFQIVLQCTYVVTLLSFESKLSQISKRIL